MRQRNGAMQNAICRYSFSIQTFYYLFSRVCFPGLMCAIFFDFSSLLSTKFENFAPLVIFYTTKPFFTARCYASAVLAMALCLSVRLSVTSRSSTKTVKRRITQTTPHDSPGTLVFGRQRTPRNSTGITPCGGAKYRWGGSKSATLDK